MRPRPIEPGTQRNPFCDFCTIALYGWEYPAADFDTLDPQTGRSWRSVGSWTACEFCRELVEAGDIAELARRAFVGLSYYARHSDSAKAANEMETNEMETNRAHYLAPAANRPHGVPGPPQRLTPTRSRLVVAWLGRMNYRRVTA